MLASDPEILGALEEEAKGRQGARTDLGHGGNNSTKSRDKAADAFGTNPRYVSDAKKVRAKKPELADRVISGELTLPEAKKKVEAAEIAEALARIPEDDREPLAGLVGAAVTSHTERLEMASRLAKMRQEDRTRVKVLAKGTEVGGHDSRGQAGTADAGR